MVMRQKNKGSRGFLLMEALLALMIFVVFVTGLSFAIHSSSNLQQVIDHKGRLSRLKKNVIIEVLKLPLTQTEFAEDRVIEFQELGASAMVSCRPATYVSQDGQMLYQLYDVNINFTYYYEGEKHEEAIVLKHYYPLYH